MTTLSDEQAAAVQAGATGGLEWVEIDLPEGPQPLPAWIKGMHVRWNDQWGNPPEFTILTVGNAHCWRDQRWRKEGKKSWVTRHSDGRAKVHYHDGRVAMTPFVERRRWQNRKFDAALQDTLDGQPRFDPTGCWADQLPGRPMMGGGIYETVWKLATSPQEGYCGRGFPIVMSNVEKDPQLRGREVVLRGPWHGGPIPGYVAVNTVEIEDVQKQQKVARRWRRPWHRLTACYGLIISEDLLIRMFARFCPHLRLARVRYSYGWRIEPLKPEWNMPKKAMQDQENATRRAAMIAVGDLARAAMPTPEPVS